MKRLQDRLDVLHDGFLYATVSLTFLATAVGGYTPLWLLIGFPTGLIASYVVVRRGLAGAVPRGWWNGAMLAVMAASGMRYLLNPALDVMVIGVQFVLVLMLVKLLSRTEPRDGLQVYAMSFIAMAATTQINQQLSYGLLFGGYLLAATFGLALFHLKREADDHPHSIANRVQPFDRLYVAVLAAITVFVLVSSVVIYLAFPRIGLGFFADPSRNSIPIAGFSEEVDVGDHGAIRDNPEVVMRVDFEGDRPTDYAAFRWRTRTFDHFDGHRWSREASGRKTSAPYSLDKTYDLGSLYTPALRQLFDERAARTITVELEPLGTNAIPTLWPTTAIELGEVDVSRFLARSDPDLEYDDYGDLYHDLPDGAGLTYDIEVQPQPGVDRLRRTTGRRLDDDKKAPYLQLPEVDDRLHRLAEELTAGADSNYETAEAIGDHMVAEFEYTTDLPEIEGDDPIAEFLFDHRRGHCEYFATSAVMLLRSAGVPTRLVNGFLGGTWNDIGDYLTVRHGDAHAWIEVFVPEYGWVPYDPTPPIESAFLDRLELARLASDTVDALERGWTLWFIEYDLDDQAALVRDIGRSLAPASAAFGDTDDEQQEEVDSVIPLREIVFWTGWLALIAVAFRRRVRQTRIRPKKAALLCVAMIAAAVWVGWFRGWTPLWTSAGAASVFATAVVPALLRARSDDSPQGLATRTFRDIERRARIADADRRPGEGPGDYLRRLKDEFPEAAGELDRFRAVYLKMRFGAGDAGAQMADELRRAAERVVGEIGRR